MTSVSALFVGDISWDTTALVDHLPGADEKVLTQAFVEDCGGVVANAAAACALTGIATQLVVALSSDWAGGQAAARLASRGVEIRRCAVEGPSCRAVITLNGDGEKRLILSPGASMYPPLFAVRQLDLAHASWVHTALYDMAAASALIGRCRDSGVRWSIDLEPATIPDDAGDLAACLAGCQTVFLNHRAAALLAPDPVEKLLAHGVVEVVETLGRRGARITDSDSSTYVPGPRGLGAIVDTTGAGDALAGQYVAGRVLGQSPTDALRRAVEVASSSCTKLGGQASYTTIPQTKASTNHTPV